MMINKLEMLMPQLSQINAVRIIEVPDSKYSHEKGLLKSIRQLIIKSFNNEGQFIDTYWLSKF